MTRLSQYNPVQPLSNYQYKVFDQVILEKTDKKTINKISINVEIHVLLDQTRFTLFNLLSTFFLKHHETISDLSQIFSQSERNGLS